MRSLGERCLCFLADLLNSSSTNLQVSQTRAYERIATAHMMIQEREWAVLRDRRQPERELRQVDCQRVEVDAVDTGLRHAPLPIGKISLTSCIGWRLLDVFNQKAGDVL